jgi:hypothetical protein
VGHEINRDERRGKIRAKDQLRYSKSPEKVKRDWHEISRMKGEEGSGPQTSLGTARVLKNVKREWHKISKDERSGRTRAKAS